MTTVGVTNMTQACIDGISDTVAGMQTTTDPYASQTESLATSGAGEIQRLRFMIGRMFGLQDWYRHDQNVNFAHAGGGVNVQGSGLGRHVTAVGYHSWGGSARFPAITGGYVHTTGFFWPSAHHLAIAVDPAVEADKTGVEVLRLHFEALTLHHTVAIRFRHSSAGLASWQYPHVTALRITRPDRTPSGSLPLTEGVDQIVVGHQGVVLNLEGVQAQYRTLSNVAAQLRFGEGGTIQPTPASLGFAANNSAGAFVDYITLVMRRTDSTAGSEDAHLAVRTQVAGTLADRLSFSSTTAGGGAIGFARHAGAVTVSANALYGDTVPKAWVSFSGSTADAPVNASFNVASVTDAGPGQYIVTWDADFSSASYTVVVTPLSGSSALVATVESQASTHAVVRTWSALGTPGTAADATTVFVLAIGAQ